jgi:hypothetical protein
MLPLLSRWIAQHSSCFMAPGAGMPAATPSTPCSPPHRRARPLRLGRILARLPAELLVLQRLDLLWPQLSASKPRSVVEDLASIVEPGIFIVDDVALPPPITFLVLPGEIAVVAKLVGSRVRGVSGRNQRGQRESCDKCLHDTSPCLDHRPTICASAQYRSASSLPSYIAFRKVDRGR